MENIPRNFGETLEQMRKALYETVLDNKLELGLDHDTAAAFAKKVSDAAVETILVHMELSGQTIDSLSPRDSTEGGKPNERRECSFVSGN